MLRIAAVDDEKHVLERFARMVEKIKDVELCGLFETGEQLLDFLSEEQLDAVFLDIEMPGINGLQLAQELLELDEKMEIVFVTAFNQYAVEAFDVQAVDYLMKPIILERLEKILRRLLRPRSILEKTTLPYMQCIGSFEMYINGKALSWKNSKAKEVLAFLVHKKGIPLNWEQIADAVWPEYNAEKAHANFHATTYLLRKKLADIGFSFILENSRGNYRIVQEQIKCDIYQLEEQLRNKNFRRRDDSTLLEKLLQQGYLEENGYEWSYPRAAELTIECQEVLDNLQVTDRYQK
ncbi:MAG: response regulator [Clostridia bacterium]